MSGADAWEGRLGRRNVLALAAGTGAAMVLPRFALAQTSPIRVAVAIGEIFAEPVYANALGYYKKAGLAVDVIGLRGSEPVVAAVLTSNAEFGITSPIVVADAIVHNLPLRMVGYCAQYTSKAPQPALFVTKDSPLKSARDLVGKTIGVNAIGTMNSLGIVAWLTKNGVDPNSVRMIEVPFPAMVTAMERGTVDAGVLGEPFIVGAGDRIRMLAPAFEVMGPHWPISVWVARLDYIRAQQALIARFMDIAYATGRFINAHPDVANPIIANYLKLPLETAAAEWHAQFAEAPNPDAIRPELEAAYEFKLLPRRVTVEELASTT